MVRRTNEKPINVQHPENSTSQSLYETIYDLMICIIQTTWLVFLGIYRLFFRPPAKSVKGEIVLITGAGYGIGNELALEYASNGATVVAWDINETNLRSTIAEIEEMNYPKAHAYKCDVSNRVEVMKIADQVQNEVGFVSILVNNAGVLYSHKFLEHTVEEIERTMNVNVMAHFWILQAFLPEMIKNNRGHIVALSSLGGQLGLLNLVAYSASKFAVRGMMEALHVELDRNPNNNIKFTTVYPYLANTGLFSKPVIRFEHLMPLLSPKHVAKHIISAQRRNVIETTIPKYFLTAIYLSRLFPVKVIFLGMKFLNAYVDEENKKLM